MKQATDLCNLVAHLCTLVECVLACHCAGYRKGDGGKWSLRIWFNNEQLKNLVWLT